MVIREQGGLPPSLVLGYGATGLATALSFYASRKVAHGLRQSRPSVCPPVRLSVRLSTASLSDSPRTPLSYPPFSHSCDIGDNDSPWWLSLGLLISNEIVRERAMARSTSPAEIFVGLTTEYSTELMLPALPSAHTFELIPEESCQQGTLKASRCDASIES